MTDRLTNHEFNELINEARGSERKNQLILIKQIREKAIEDMKVCLIAQLEMRRSGLALSYRELDEHKYFEKIINDYGKK